MRDSRGRFTIGNTFASIGGRARADRLTPTRRREIAKMGLKGLADSRFGGDAAAARDWLIKAGLRALDSHYPQALRKYV